MKPEPPARRAAYVVDQTLVDVIISRINASPGSAGSAEVDPNSADIR